MQSTVWYRYSGYPHGSFVHTRKIQKSGGNNTERKGMLLSLGRQTLKYIILTVIAERNVMQTNGIQSLRK